MKWLLQGDKEMPIRSDLKPIFRKYPNLLPIFGLVFILFSPLLMPVLVLLKNKNDVMQYFSECKESFEKVT